MQIILYLLVLQGLMGAFDTIYHHELTVALPGKKTAQRELRLHAIRSSLYAVVFAGLAWFEWRGLWLWGLSALILIEIALTLCDFVEEDKSRLLPATERVTHTILAMNGGALFGYWAISVAPLWASQSTSLHLVNYGLWSWVLSLFALGVGLSGIRDGFASLKLYKEAKIMTSNPFLSLPQQRILITGGTGFIGGALCEHLLAAGHSLCLLSRNSQATNIRFQSKVRAFSSWEDLSYKEEFDVIINLAGSPVAGPRWSDARKKALLASRIGTTEGLLGWLARANHKPKVLINGSAIGYYGCRGDEALDENAGTQKEFMSQLCSEWEAAACKAEAFGLRVVRLRLGLVFGPGGALPKLLLPFYFGLGGRMGDGLQVISWIHRDDVLAVIAQAINDPQLSGAYNLSAPEAVSQAQFAQTAARLLRRPRFFTTPAWLIDTLAGEMGALFTKGQRVIPKRLLDAGYRFKYPDLQSALQAQIKGGH
ncbi:TIGR01777 family oxidoreductase [Janthinobacterium sp. B9-8]|uniref:TIGR01777 family oxidoreductase n=1 Tax=Janthinobacterium sp. B9-8 TaxID=1236179 RepID=UPI00061D0718|nr:TIGR01777 family oxidoreductase [Janthinobacterium sp. B9-8]AMC35200.1 NAD-dependent dehydratase [Janthinobacterium sp. B9-8]